MFDSLTNALTVLVRINLLLIIMNLEIMIQNLIRKRNTNLYSKWQLNLRI